MLSAHVLANILETRNADGHTIRAYHREGTRYQLPTASTIAGVIGKDFRINLTIRARIAECHLTITGTESKQVLIVGRIGFPAVRLLRVNHAPTKVIESLDDLFG